jgi:hypothetical protein
MRITVTEADRGTPFRLVAKVGESIETRWRILPDQIMERAFQVFLSASSCGESGLSREQRGALKGLAGQPGIDIYAARWCESSSTAVEAAARVAVERPSIRLRILDVESFEQSLLPIGMSSVPLAIVGGKARIYGAFTPGELISALESFADGKWERQTLLNMLQQKMRAEIDLLLRNRLLSARSVASLVGEASMGVRMGGILILSELAKTDRGAAGDALGPLVDLLKAPEPQMRADAIYALGELCDLRALEDLEKMNSDPNADVREGALEAREKIKAFNVLRR